MPKMTKTDRLKREAFREVRAHEPEHVRATRIYQGDAAAEKQIRAIALQKARDNGARIPRPRKRGA